MTTWLAQSLYTIYQIPQSCLTTWLAQSLCTIYQIPQSCYQVCVRWDELLLRWNLRMAPVGMGFKIDILDYHYVGHSGLQGICYWESLQHVSTDLELTTKFIDDIPNITTSIDISNITTKCMSRIYPKKKNKNNVCHAACKRVLG